MTDTPPGTIIVLNGCASAGKTSIAKAIQRTFPEPYLHLGIDHFWIDVQPWEWAGAPAQIIQAIPVENASPPKIASVPGPFGKFVVSGLHHSVAALSRIGHNVVVDQMFYDASFFTELPTLWKSLPVWLVGVHCPLETLCERAAARADRSFPGYIPMITWMFDEVHKYTQGIYDLEVDTSRLTPTECALQIKQMVDKRGSPSALERIAAL